MKSYAFTLLLTCSMQLLFAQAFRNLEFEESCAQSETQLCDWGKAWGSTTAFSVAPGKAGNGLRLSNAAANAVSFASQAQPIPLATNIRMLEVSAYIATEDVAGRGAEITVNIMDADSNMIATKSMNGNGVVGSTAWTRYSIQLVCSEAAASIHIGAMLFGSGSATFDNFDVALTDLTKQAPSPVASSYIGSAADTIARHSLVRDAIDIGALKANALAIAAKAATPADCYIAVEYLLESLRPHGDNHSFFMPAEEADSWAGDEDAPLTYARCEVKQGYGYIWVPGFHHGSKTLIQAFADSLQRSIAALDAANVKGWIVDLRDNDGGNMEPMIAGVGPLLDQGNLGSLVDVAGKHEHWYYRTGSYGWDNEALVTVQNPVTLQRQLPIAVLTSNRTGSSGEIVAISFIGNSQTASFGQPTWGLTTGNGQFELEDGASMFLASTKMVDRNGHVFEGKVAPEFPVAPSEVKHVDASLEAALIWLARQK